MVSDQRRVFFDRSAAVWDNGDLPEKQQKLRNLFNHFFATVQTPVLDLGSGTGVLVPVLLDRKESIRKIIELDLSFRMLTQAASKVKTNGKINYINGDVHFLPFPDQRIATVICFESFPHFRHPVRAIQEFHRVLRNDGILIIMHLIGHEQLNAYHAQIGEAIWDDHLPPVSQVVQMLERENFRIMQATEKEDLYLIEARKPN